jgi:hypothetical protein
MKTNKVFSLDGKLFFPDCNANQIRQAASEAGITKSAYKNYFHYNDGLIPYID